MISKDILLNRHRRLGGNREIVSCRAVRAYVRTCVRAVLGLVRFLANRWSCPFPFPFYPGRPFPFLFYRAVFSLFPCASICSLFPCEHYEEIDSNEIK